jgi:hypothetical protein
MRGFALTDALTGLAVISLILVVLVSRGPDLQTAEADRRVRAILIDGAQAALVLSQGLRESGTWVLYDRGPVVEMPSAKFHYFNESMQAVSRSDYQLTLQVRALGSSQYVSLVRLQLEDDVVYQQEVTWSDRQGS